jgi:hypothetical protein
MAAVEHVAEDAASLLHLVLADEGVQLVALVIEVDGEDVFRASR